MNLLDYASILLISLGTSFVVQFLLLKVVTKSLSAEIGGFVGGFQEKLEEGPVKRALSHIGKMGGDRKSIEAIKDNLANDVIQAKFGQYLPFLEMAGIDVNEYLETYGASNILKAISELGPQLGFDLSKGLEGLNIGTNKGNGGYRGKIKYGT